MHPKQRLTSVSCPACRNAATAPTAAPASTPNPEVNQFSISYMLAGEGQALGVSKVDPFASDENQWVKEGPHLMILVPDPAALEGLSTDPTDPVHVMWKDTPYAHIMVKVAEEKSGE